MIYKRRFQRYSIIIRANSFHHGWGFAGYPSGKKEERTVGSGMQGAHEGRLGRPRSPREGKDRLSLLSLQVEEEKEEGGGTRLGEQSGPICRSSHFRIGGPTGWAGSPQSSLRPAKREHCRTRANFGSLRIPGRGQESLRDITDCV